MIQLVIYPKPSNLNPEHLLYTIIYLNVKILLLKLKNQTKYKQKQTLNKKQHY